MIVNERRSITIVVSIFINLHFSFGFIVKGDCQRDLGSCFIIFISLSEMLFLTCFMLHPIFPSVGTVSVGYCPEYPIDELSQSDVLKPIRPNQEIASCPQQLSLVPDRQVSPQPSS